MKTKNVVLSVLVAMFVSVFAFANEPGNPRIAVVSPKTGIYKVIYEAVKEGKVSVKIFSSNGEQVFGEVIKSTNGFMRPVNFKGMEPGEYTIEIASGENTQTQKVSYK
jgi:Secretion system C-terminal sorting domain